MAAGQITRKGCNNGCMRRPRVEFHPSTGCITNPLTCLDKWVLCLVTKSSSRPVNYQSRRGIALIHSALWFAINCDCEMKRQCQAQFWHCVHLQRCSSRNGGGRKDPNYVILQWSIVVQNLSYGSLTLRLMGFDRRHSIGHCSSPPFIECALNHFEVSVLCLEKCWQ